MISSLKIALYGTAFALATLFIQPALAEDSKDMLVIRTTPKSPDDVADAVKAYSEKMKWQYIEPTKVKQGQVTLIKTCIPAVGGKLWPVGLHIAAILPCGNLAAYVKDGKTEVSMLKAAYMSKLYPHPTVDEAVKVAEPLLAAMMDEILK